MDKKRLVIALIIVFSVISSVQVVFGAPGYTIMRSIIPEQTGIFDIGTSSLRYNGAFKDVNISGTCTGCGGSSQWATSTENPSAIHPAGATRVGIGTTSPWRAFSVSGTSDLGTNALAGTFTATSSGISTFAGSLFVGNNLNIGGSSIHSDTGNLTVSADGEVHFGSGNGIVNFNGNSAINLSLIQTQPGVDFHVSTAAATQRLTILNSSGNVGIGTTSPYTRLAVFGTTTSSTFHATSTTGVNLFDGKVGIGNIIPRQSLEVVGGTRLGESTGSNGNTDPTGGGFERSLYLRQSNIVLDVLQGIYIDYGLLGDTTRPMFTENAGDVSFGNEIVGSMGFSTSGGTVMDFSGSTARVRNNLVVGATAGIETGHTLNAYAANGSTLAFSIAGSGRIGVGSTTPFATLSVSSTTQNIGMLPLFTVASTTHSTLFTVLGSGNVGIGTTTPIERFQVQGDSAGSATKGTCFRAKAVGANSYVYWWFKADATQVTQTTSCSGVGTTTITYD